MVCVAVAVAVAVAPTTALVNSNKFLLLLLLLPCSWTYHRYIALTFLVCFNGRLDTCL